MLNHSLLVMRSVLAIAFISSLSGCEDLGINRFLKDTGPVAAQAVDLPHPEADPITNPATIFDGTRSITTNLPISLSEFAISVRLLPAGPAPSPAVYADTTPPQPFRVGTIAATHSGNTLIIGTVTLADFTQLTSIVLVSQEGQRLKVYRDNKLSGDTESAQPFQNVVIGRGHKERYWAGQIEEFRIFDITGAQGSVEPSDISSYPVVYELHNTN